MRIQSEIQKQNILKEEKKLLGLEPEEDYKMIEEIAPKTRKKIRRR